MCASSRDETVTETLSLAEAVHDGGDEALAADAAGAGPCPTAVRRLCDERGVGHGSERFLETKVDRQVSREREARRESPSTAAAAQIRERSQVDGISAGGVPITTAISLRLLSGIVVGSPVNFLPST